MGVMWNGVPRCGGVIWCTLWFDVKCGAMWNVAISNMVWNMAWCGMCCPGM